MQPQNLNIRSADCTSFYGETIPPVKACWLGHLFREIISVIRSMLASCGVILLLRVLGDVCGLRPDVLG